MPSCQVTHTHTQPQTHMYTHAHTCIHDNGGKLLSISLLNYSLFCRMRSLKSALELLEPTDIRIKQISDELDQNIRKPLDITGFALTDLTALYGDTKVIYLFICLVFFQNIFQTHRNQTTATEKKK